MNPNLEKLYKILDERGIPRSRVVSPLDRLLIRLEIIDAPLSFGPWSFQFGLGTFLVFIALFIPSVVGLPAYLYVSGWSYMDYTVMYFILAVFLGSLGTWSFRRQINQANLPSWEEITRSSSGR